MPPLDLQPTLKGHLVALRPLALDYFLPLYAVAADPLIWQQHPEPDRHHEPVFRTFFDKAIATRAAFAIIDNATAGIIGSTRYHTLDDPAEIEIGWTFLARSHWGGRYNADAKRLLLDHAFRAIERVAFFIGADNIRSQRAIERIGAVRTAELLRPDPRGRPIPYLKYVITCPAPAATTSP